MIRNPKITRTTAVAVLFWGIFIPACSPHKPVPGDRSSPGGRVEFSREFAPSEGLVRGPEAATRKEICLNGKWDFQPIYGPYNETQTPPYGIDAKETAPDLPDPLANGWASTRMKIPSPWNAGAAFPSYPEEWGQARMGWLRKQFAVPADWKNERIILRFQAVSGDCKVLLNGKEIGGNFDSVLPFDFDITDKVRKGAENEVMVGIRSHTFFNRQGAYGKITYPPGAPGMGIWQDVYLLALPRVYVSDVFIQPEVAENHLIARITIRNTTREPQSLNVGADIREWINLTGKDSLSAPEVKWKLGGQALEMAPVKAVIPAGGQSVVVLNATVDNELRYWDFDSPNLYGLTVSLINDQQVIDRKYERFGWREFRISGKDLLLNGKKIQLLGDAQHLQNVTFMTRRYAWSWFKLLKDIGGNAARLHALVYPEYFHDMADEMGIALLPESSIYASSCDINYDSDLFWKAAKYNVRGMVEKYRNHPSVYGWSIENEVLPALNVKCNDPAYKKMVYDGMNGLADICRGLDSTRQWISGDGSGDMDGRLPVYNEHYGSTDSYLRNAAATSKPFAVGEASIAYYAKPSLASMYVGDRAYRSYKDFSDAAAVDVYELLKVERKVAAYCSVWNAGFYGVEFLPLGMSDISKTPGNDDGVFLTAPYVEGKPGIQPERIPPYAAQYNPGYDSRYPLYKPLPLYYAVKAAYAQPGPAPCAWDHRSQYTDPPAPVIKDPIREVLFCGREDSSLYFKLKSIGIPLVTVSSTAKMILVDCHSVDMDVALQTRIRDAVKAGAIAIFWGLTPSNTPRMAPALPYPVEVFDRPATSLVSNEQDNRVASIPYKDLYFTENTDSKEIMQYALKGDFVRQGNVLLKACPADWDRGNNGGMMRSERENPAGPAFVEVRAVAGSYIACTIDPEVISEAYIRMMAQLFRHLGVEVKPVEVKRGSLLDQASVLTRALVAPCPKGCAWEPVETKNGLFRFNNKENLKVNQGNVKVNQGNIKADSGDVYLSFWLRCPKPLNEIMADPNVPVVNFSFSLPSGGEIWLNDRKRFESVRPVDNGLIEKLPLVKGWNHFLVKVAGSPDKQRVTPNNHSATSGSQRVTPNNRSFTGRFLSKDLELLSSMGSALDPYSDKANFYTVAHTDPEITYDRVWALQGDGWHESSTPGSRAVFKFNGTGISLSGLVGPDGGKARVYIDGKLDKVVDYKARLRDPHTLYYSRSGLNDGEHELVLEVIEGVVSLGSYEQWERYKSTF